jgi:hypothetical protein
MQNRKRSEKGAMKDQIREQGSRTKEECESVDLNQERYLRDRRSG